MNEKLKFYLKLVLSCIQIPLWFIPIFHTVAYFPTNIPNKTIKEDYFHSMYQNVKSSDCLFLLFISMALIIVSAVLAIIELKIKNKKLAIASKIIFITSILFFMIAMFIAGVFFSGKY